MPVTRSAQKALRQNLKRRRLNLRRKDKIKETIKNFRRLYAEKKYDEARSALKGVYKVLDKAAKVGAIKKNRASRLKSRLSRMLVKQT